MVHNDREQDTVIPKQLASAGRCPPEPPADPRFPPQPPEQENQRIGPIVHEPLPSAEPEQAQAASLPFYPQTPLPQPLYDQQAVPSLGLSQESHPLPRGSEPGPYRGENYQEPFKPAEPAQMAAVAKTEPPAPLPDCDSDVFTTDSRSGAELDGGSVLPSGSTFPTGETPAELATDPRLLAGYSKFDRTSGLAPIVQPSQPASPVSQKSCLTPGCDGSIRARGLCGTCYSAARLRVNSGVSTWDSLAADGLALPSKKKKTGDDGAAFNAAFAKAQENQEAKALADKDIEEQMAVVGAPTPLRIVPNYATAEELRLAAEAVGTNPSQQNLEKLVAVQARLQPSPVAVQPSPVAQEQVYAQPVVQPGVDPANLPQLPANMVWENGPSGMFARQMSEEEIIIEERKAGQAKYHNLRKRSLEDSTIGSATPRTIDEGDVDNTGMSDEEFDRIRTAHAIRTGQIPQPPPTVVPISARQKPVPSFPEPPAPEDLMFDPALESGAP